MGFRFFRVALSTAPLENQPPFVSPIFAESNGTTTTYFVEAQDPENGELVFAWSNSNDCGTFSADGGFATWEYPNPPCPEEADHPATVSLEVSDGEWIVRVEYPYGSEGGLQGTFIANHCGAGALSG